MATYQRPLSVVLPPKYDKAKDLYSRMAIYFDLHIHDKERDDELLYQYLYHIIYMLTCKANYFHNWEDIDHFALFGATRIYLRAISPTNESGERIKSILNYVKSTLNPMKCDFQKEDFHEVINPDYDTDFNAVKYQESLASDVQSNYNNGLTDDIEKEFKKVPMYIQKVVSQSPYKNDKLLCYKLYMSVLITFLNNVTLNNTTKQKLMKKELTNSDLILKMYEKNSTLNATLWELDTSWKDYIVILTKQLKNLMSISLFKLRQDYELSEEDLNAVIMSAYQTEPRDNSEEM